jgi:anaerobic selenocysteine-containing dehydrogenase
MIRNKEDQLVRASWDEAMDLIVRKSRDTMLDDEPALS